MATSCQITANATREARYWTLGLDMVVERSVVFSSGRLSLAVREERMVATERCGQRATETL